MTKLAFNGRLLVQVMPVVAMALVMVLVAALLWLLHLSEVEDENRALIQDILWLEQNLHFTMESDLERLRQLADLVGRSGSEATAIDNTVRTLNTSAPEIIRIILRDVDGPALRAIPPAGADSDLGADPAWTNTLTLARATGREVYGSPYRHDGRGTLFELHVPIFRDKTMTGVLVAVFSMDALLAHHVPWWFAQAYRLEVIDGNGEVLAARSQGGDYISGLSHQLRFEPPGQGLMLVATVQRSDPHLLRNILAAAIFILALSAIFSLWGLRRHVSRRLAAEQALRAEHSFRKAMEDSLTVGMRARDLDGRITYVNPAFCRMVGWSAGELVGVTPPMPYWVPEDMERTYELHRAVLRGDAPPDGFEIVFRRKSGERFNALVYEAPLIDADGRHTGWMASVLDVTERKRVEDLARQHQEKLQHTSRLITMGEMASTLAHELNQPLSAIASYATGCLNRLALGDASAAELSPPLTKLGVQAQRAGHIIRRIHDFVRKSDPLVAPCDLCAVIEEAVGFLGAEARKRSVRVDLDLARPSPCVEADRVLIEQVVLNLARNAMEAMANTPKADRRLAVSVTVADGTATVAIADRGHGISEATAETLFQPFFTTKEDGMGMGLNICRSIIESHRGRLTFEPNPDGGARFLFTLPERAP